MQEEANYRALCKRLYGMKKHHATRLHYDLRLEWNGVLLSWALPEGPSCHAGELREAIEMEDHRTEYLTFEGVHSTGPIMLWDRGTWEPHSESEDIESSLHKGILRFTLHGEKLKGSWALTRTDGMTKPSRPVWALCKLADTYARSGTDKCVLEEWPNSVEKGRTMEEIVRDWWKPRDKHERQTGLFNGL